MTNPHSFSRRSILRALGVGVGAAAGTSLTVAHSTSLAGIGNPVRDGIDNFEDKTYPSNHDLYQRLADSQAPHTLVVTCSDSRIDVETLLSAQPGELFHLRNIANIIPHADNPDVGILAPIEYAVAKVGVKTIAVIGHSNCGGMAALQHPEDYRTAVPATHAWLQRSEVVLAEMDGDRDAEDFSLRLEQANAAAQIENLLSHRFVAERVEAGVLALEAFHYNIGHGDVTMFDQARGAFVDA